MTLTSLSTRDRLLETGAHLFVELGYAETSLRAIAERVGVKAGSIYYHFASKDDLLTEVLQIGMERITNEVRDALDQSAQLGPAERIRAAVSAHLQALFEHGPYTATHVAVFPRAPAGVRDRVVPMRDAYEALWMGLYRDLARVGAIDPAIDLQLARLTLLGSMNGALEWFNLSGHQPIDALADQIGQLHWQGIRFNTHQEDD